MNANPRLRPVRDAQTGVAPGARAPRFVAGIRAALERAGYAERAVATMTAERREGHPPGGDGDRAVGAAGLAMLRLFLHGRDVDQAAARDALAPLPLDAWADAGLVTLGAGRVTPLVKLTPYRGLLVCSDPRWDLNAAMHPDAVMGVTGSSHLLANVTVRHPVRTTLDLGTGTGVQAMLAAAHSARVIATDLNPRALAFARFNLQLNGIANVELREGDLFEPVAGERFDLIVFNPPFSISPAAACLYRDNPLDGDTFAQQIVREAPRFLRNGGHAQITCEWAQCEGQDPIGRFADWFRGGRCDAWVLRGASTPVAEYAEKWLADYDPPNLVRLRDEWRLYYESRRIVSIDTGVITMRRRTSGANWLRVDASPPRMLQHAGEHIQRGFRLRDFLDARTDSAALLRERLCAMPHLRMDRHTVSSAGGWQLAGGQLTQTRGFAFTARLDPVMTAVVHRCTGELTLGAVLADIARRVSRDTDELADTYLASVRELIALGFLWPVRANTQPRAASERDGPAAAPKAITLHTGTQLAPRRRPLVPRPDGQHARATPRRSR